MGGGGRRTFQRHLALKMEAVCSSATLVSTYAALQPRGPTSTFHAREKLKSLLILKIVTFRRLPTVGNVQNKWVINKTPYNR
jgi:hypothetical protein